MANKKPNFVSHKKPAKGKKPVGDGQDRRNRRDWNKDQQLADKRAGTKNHSQY